MHSTMLGYVKHSDCQNKQDVKGIVHPQLSGMHLFADQPVFWVPTTSAACVFSPLSRITCPMRGDLCFVALDEQLPMFLILYSLWRHRGDSLCPHREPYGMVIISLGL